MVMVAKWLEERNGWSVPSVVGSISDERNIKSNAPLMKCVSVCLFKKCNSLLHELFVVLQVGSFQI